MPSETPKLDKVLVICRDNRANGWPPLTSDRNRLIDDARAELVALREKITKNEAFIRHLERASEIVSTWPEWKQNLLGRRAMNQVDQAARRAAEKTANPSCNASGCCCEKSIETHQRIIAAEFAPLLAEACGLLERVKPYMFGYGIELDCNKLNQRVSVLDDIDKFLAAKRKAVRQLEEAT